MNTITRTLIAAALLASLAACGNKGALLKPSQIPSVQTPEEPAPEDATPVQTDIAPIAPVPPQDDEAAPLPTDNGDDPGNG